ncbi:cupin domain-containing protein [Candidatus Wolfebacteria bacterium]|nr:cupin domain-containing protein [Candidatus Wolfebacteria bacterium]
MNIKEYKQIAKLIRDNETYRVYDLSKLKNLEISLTELHLNKSTKGHFHNGIDEVYIFIQGEGEMEIGEKIFKVKAGDIMLVEPGKFHKVYNKGKEDLNFWAIFEKYEGRGK